MFRKYLSETPKNRASLNDVSGVIFLLLCNKSLTLDDGTCKHFASLLEDIPAGFIKSSRSISPTVGVGIRLFIMLHLFFNQ